MVCYTVIKSNSISKILICIFINITVLLKSHCSHLKNIPQWSNYKKKNTQFFDHKNLNYLFVDALNFQDCLKCLWFLGYLINVVVESMQFSTEQLLIVSI